MLAFLLSSRVLYKRFFYLVESVHGFLLSSSHVQLLRKTGLVFLGSMSVSVSQMESSSYRVVRACMGIKAGRSAM